MGTGEECVIASVSRYETAGWRFGEDAGERPRAGGSICTLQGAVGRVLVVRWTLVTCRRKEPADFLSDLIRLSAGSNRVLVATSNVRRLIGAARRTPGRLPGAAGDQDGAQGGGERNASDRDGGMRRGANISRDWLVAVRLQNRPHLCHSSSCW